MNSCKAANCMLRLTVSDSRVLGTCYMPFLRHKGLFVPSLQSRELGERVFLVLTLRQQNKTAAGMADVCWITPQFCSTGREPGFGLHFDEGADELRTLIESGLSADKNGRQIEVSYTL